MPATIKKNGGPDTGHVGAICEDEGCRDINGRPWQVWHSRRTVEGATLAKRDAEDHNRARHAAQDECSACAQLKANGSPFRCNHCRRTAPTAAEQRTAEVTRLVVHEGLTLAEAKTRVGIA